jgi:hypothetical protein
MHYYSHMSCQQPLQHGVANVQAETRGVGIGGFGGNKGGVAIRFDLFESSMCFINAHLAAHQVRSITCQTLTRYPIVLIVCVIV